MIDSLGYGGSERQLALTVKSLDRNRFDNVICYLHPQDHLTQGLEADGIRTYGLNLPEGKQHWPKAMLEVRRLVRSLGIDLIHTSLFESDLIGGIAGRLAGVPSVSTLCNIGGEAERLVDNPSLNKWKLFVTTKLWGFVLRYGHKYCIANSQSVMESAVRTYGLRESHMSVIYRALSESWSESPDKARMEKLPDELSLRGSYPLLVNVGRLVPQKGQRYLIQAMPEVLKQHPKTRLLMIGDGPLRESLTALCRELGVAGQVRFLGHRDDVRELLALSDIFTFPSLFEGCPNALIEAMAMAKPCVASRIGPNEEVIEDGQTGLLVAPQSSKALAAGIMQMTRDREAADRMGEKGRQTVVEKFALDPSIRQLQEVYGKLVGTTAHDSVSQAEIHAANIETRR